MKKENIDFGTILTEYLKRHHPHLARKTEWIETRRLEAENTYRKACESGMTLDKSMQEAMHTLLDGCLFSPYSILEEAVDECFGYSLAEADKEILCQRLLAKFAPLFEGYTITDDFIRSQAYPKLLRELTGAIRQFLAGEPER